MFSIDGIVSGFETSTIIESLLGFQQNQIDTFNSRKAEITTRQSAFKGIEAQLVTLRSSLGRLNRSAGSVFDQKLTTSSNEDILSVAADGNANNGFYQLTVNSLATAEQLGSQGFTSTSELVGTGTFTLSVGGRTATTVSVDNGNNTVTGFVNAINDQVEDVNASVVFDQGAGSYRILLSSNLTGADNTITISNGLSGGTTPDFSGPAVQSAANAVVTLGSGPGAITAEYSSNTVDSLIENVTIDLKSASATETVTINVQNDNESAREAIETFVNDYNSVIEFIEEQTRFDPESGNASPLISVRQASTIKNELLNLVSESVPTGTSLRRLSQIGIDIDTRGRLSINSARLEQAFNGELDGIDSGDIRKLFGLDGTSDNAGVRFLAGSNRTVDSSTPYQVDITQAAEQASITATNAVASSIVIDDSNNSFQITVDGVVSEELTLTNGTYTAEELASQLETTINSSNELGFRNVLVGLSGSNELIITTEGYGLSSKLSSVTGDASSILGFTGIESDSGVDVVGSFIVNGQAETAVGTGRILRGEPDNANTADLQLEVTLTPDRVVAGAEAEVLVTRGVTGNLETYLGDLFDAESGLLKTVNDDFTARVDSIDESIARVEALTESRREFLIREFTALESILSELQNTGNIISSQLSTISAFGNDDN
ncbi:MAG: flagellar filament capping protein FliD [Planctomycetota bacterium]